MRCAIYWHTHTVIGFIMAMHMYECGEARSPADLEKSGYLNFRPVDCYG